MQRQLGSVLMAASIILAAAASSAGQSSAPAHAQTRSADASGSPAFDIAMTYDATISDDVNGSHRALQGGSVQFHRRFYRGWGAVADIAGAVAGKSGSSVGLHLVTTTFGPRYMWSPAEARWNIFGQALVGTAFGSNSIFPAALGATTSAQSLAVKTGGGLNLNLKSHLALRALEIDYLRTQLPNGTNNVQNNVILGAGIVFSIR